MYEPATLLLLFDFIVPNAQYKVLFFFYIVFFIACHDSSTFWNVFWPTFLLPEPTSRFQTHFVCEDVDLCQLIFNNISYF